MSEDPRPDLLPGLSATRLFVRGNLLMMAAGLFAIPLVFESKLGSYEDLYIGLLLGAAALLLAAGGLVTWASHRKERNETEHGYTTNIKTAVANPELYHVDYKTLAVLSKPHEPRFTRSALRRN